MSHDPQNYPPEAESRAGQPPRMPTWVKVSVAVAAVLIVVVVIVLATGMGGEHGPTRHSPSGFVDVVLL